MPYQSFDDQKGDSNSTAKLSALKLPEKLEGYSVLDIGCNEGFFCQAVLNRGAGRVLGIDFNPELIKRAERRVPGAEFKTTSWWNLPNERFDLILFLSAIHYEKDQGKLLDYLYEHLTPRGILVLECGAVENWDSSRWILAQRHDGIVRFPTTRLLFDRLLAKYSAREVGYSVMQSGDPVPRIVVHARQKQPTIVVIAGDSWSGKSSLARTMGKSNFPVLHVDYMLGEIFSNRENLSGELVSFVQQSMKELDVFQLSQRMSDAKKFDLLAKHILNLISTEADLSIVEGYPMSKADMQEIFSKLAEERGFKVVRIDL